MKFIMHFLLSIFCKCGSFYNREQLHFLLQLESVTEITLKNARIPQTKMVRNWFRVLLLLSNLYLLEIISSTKIFSVFCQPEIYKYGFYNPKSAGINGLVSIKKSKKPIVKHQNICNYSEYLKQLLIDIKKREITDVLGPTSYNNYELCNSIDNLIEDHYVETTNTLNRRFDLRYRNFICQNKKYKNFGTNPEAKKIYDSPKNYLSANKSFEALGDILASVMVRLNWMTTIIVASNWGSFFHRRQCNVFFINFNLRSIFEFPLELMTNTIPIFQSQSSNNF